MDDSAGSSIDCDYSKVRPSVSGAVTVNEHSVMPQWFNVYTFYATLVCKLLNNVSSPTVIAIFMENSDAIPFS